MGPRPGGSAGRRVGRSRHRPTNSEGGRPLPTREDIRTYRGAELRGADDEKIGTIDEIYVDHETDQPEWALVNTGLFGTKRSFVPLANARREGGAICVPYDKSQIKDAPQIESDAELSQDEEAALYRHYGLEYGESRSETGLAEGGDADAMTRSEEELRAGTVERERGRVRLKKWVETEDVQETVPVRREEVRVEREPITDDNVDEAMSGPEISEGEHEVVLHEEEPVAEKRTVPKERVRLDKDVETDEYQVADTVRQERIDVDRDA